MRLLNIKETRVISGGETVNVVYDKDADEIFARQVIYAVAGLSGIGGGLIGCAGAGYYGYKNYGILGTAISGILGIYAGFAVGSFSGAAMAFPLLKLVDKAADTFRV